MPRPKDHHTVLQGLRGTITSRSPSDSATAASVGKLTTKRAEALAENPVFEGAEKTRAKTPLIVCAKNISAQASPTLVEGSREGESSSVIATAKPKARQHPPHPRERRRIEKNRRHNFEAGTRFAYKMGWPINIAITINWTALIQAGEHNEGHCLFRSERARETYLRAELTRSRPQSPEGTPFVAIWGRDIGSRMGLHTHLALHWSLRSKTSLFNLLALMQRVTGSAAVETPQDRRKGNLTFASSCRGWLVETIYGKDLLTGALNWVDYIARQSENHAEWPDLAGKAFGISEAIGPKARSRFQRCG